MKYVMLQPEEELFIQQAEERFAVFLQEDALLLNPQNLQEAFQKKLISHKPLFLKKVSFPKDRKNIEIGDYKADYSKMTKTFGWKPMVSLDIGIKKTLEYYEKYKRYYW